MNWRNSWTVIRLGWESPWRIRRNARRLLESPLIRLGLRLQGVKVGKRSRFFGAPLVNRYRGSLIQIGSDVEMRNRTNSNVLGLSHPVVLSTLSRQAQIVIGDHVGLSGVSICAALAIRIGEGTIIGVDALITDTDHHPLKGSRTRFTLEGARTEQITIGKDVFIGARAIILKGCQIGDRAAIGAGSVVTANVPAGVVVAGNPARIVGTVEQPDIAGQLATH